MPLSFRLQDGQNLLSFNPRGLWDVLVLSAKGRLSSWAERDGGAGGVLQWVECLLKHTEPSLGFISRST